MGKLRAQADQRKRDEAALRDLEEYLGQLQADLKVGLQQNGESAELTKDT
jgi:hypothetical protein